MITCIFASSMSHIVYCPVISQCSGGTSPYTYQYNTTNHLKTRADASENNDNLSREEWGRVNSRRFSCIKYVLENGLCTTWLQWQRTVCRHNQQQIHMFWQQSCHINSEHDYDAGHVSAVTSNCCDCLQQNLSLKCSSPWTPEHFRYIWYKLRILR